MNERKIFSDAVEIVNDLFNVFSVDISDYKLSRDKIFESYLTTFLCAMDTLNIDNLKKEDFSGREDAQIVKAMEFICRQINDEYIFYGLWLSDGVADGDIPYGDLDYTGEDDEVNYYLDTEIFKDLVLTFVKCMKMAFQYGGLYVDKIVSFSLT